MVQRDKLWHAVVSACLVLIFFGCICVGWHYYRHRFLRAASSDYDRENVQEGNKRNEQDDDKSGLDQYLRSECNILAISCLLSFMIGASKEIADAVWNEWPWCSNGVCNGDGWDILANMVGISIGGILIALAICLMRERRKQKRITENS